MDFFLMLLFLISSNLTTNRFYFFTRLSITIELTLTSFLTNDVLMVTLVEDAITLFIEYTDREVTSMTENDCNFFNCLQLVEVTRILNLLLLLDLFLFIHFLDDLLLSAQQTLHVCEIKIS